MPWTNAEEIKMIDELEEQNQRLYKSAYYLLGYAMSCLGSTYRSLELNKDDHISKLVMEELRDVIYYIQDKQGHERNINI